MKNKVIFELKLDRDKSLIAYENEHYEEVYDDSFLVMKTKYRSIKLVESSFCYGFGAEMYYRIHNIHEIESLSSFVASLKKCIEYNDCYSDNADQEIIGFNNKYDFVGCNHKELYLGTMEGKYLLLLLRFHDSLPNRLKIKVIKIIEISAENFKKWLPIIKNEWERRAIIEGTRGNDNSTNKEDWEKYFEYMRS